MTEETNTPSPEMPIKHTWLSSLVSDNKAILTALRVATIGLLAASFTMGLGYPAFIATGIVSTGLSYVTQRQTQTAKQKMLLKVYRNDLAVLLHKAPDDVTLDDLSLAAAPKEQGGLGIITIKKQLDFYDYYKTRRFGLESTTYLLAAVALAVIGANYPVAVTEIGNFAMAVGVGAFAYLDNAFIAGTRAFLTQQDYKVSVNKFLMDVSVELKTKPIQPIRVMGILAAVDDDLQNGIQQKYGAKFQDLTSYQKMQVVNDYEPTMRIIALTQQINKGTIKPSIIGFLAYGQTDYPLPDLQKYEALKAREPLTSPETAPLPEPSEEKQKISYVDRLQAERGRPASSLALN